MAAKRAGKVAFWLSLAVAALCMAISLGVLLEVWYHRFIVVPVDTDVWVALLGLPMRPFTLRTRGEGWVGVCAQVQGPHGRTISACLWQNVATAANEDGPGGLRSRLVRARAHFRPGERWQFVGVSRRRILVKAREGLEFESEGDSQSQPRRLWLGEKALPEAVLQIVIDSGGR